MKLIHGDCLEKMKDIPDKSIDMILCDLPYGTTDCTWDSVINLIELWANYRRIIKPRGGILLFGSEPFSSILRTSNLKAYRTEWFWNKRSASNVGLVKYHPLKIIETISVFGFEPVNYYPTMTKGKKRMKGGKVECNTIQSGLKPKYVSSDLYYPKNLIEIKKDRGFHPTQKPVALLEYLIKTYTLEGETVLDNTMGSGSTGVACVNTNRNFIGIEKDDKYFEITKKRIEEAISGLSQNVKQNNKGELMAIYTIEEDNTWKVQEIKDGVKGCRVCNGTGYYTTYTDRAFEDGGEYTNRYRCTRCNRQGTR